ncbi:hypothetical protein [Bradyrhizobium sp. Tv2a-2]|uniref:hypothetical protein n=1 Tax=Bradyrhizobium sp. Tv2a-2 TaxID=113395 RepID=UPI0003F8E761|nr:hypothetical protein [Bradyrhizobium sp. Tv2a-2]
MTFDAPVLSIEDQISAFEERIEFLKRTAETGQQWAEIARLEQEMVKLLPMDELVKAASSIEHGTKLTRDQIAWARSHDWFDDATADGVLFVYDRFTYRGRSYTNRVIWGGSFGALRDWAGY